MLTNTVIFYKTQEEAVKIQEALFTLGHRWCGCGQQLNKDLYNAGYIRTDDSSEINFGAVSTKGYDWICPQPTKLSQESLFLLADGWTLWEGGDCPVEKGTLVDVTYRDGSRCSAVPANKNVADYVKDANSDFWNNDNMDNDIIAYKLSAPSTPSRKVNLEEAVKNVAEDLGKDVVAIPVEELKGSKVVSDGGSSSYYMLKITNKAGESVNCEMSDIIRDVYGNDFDLGNIVKAARRMYEVSKGRGKEGTSIAYDANKVVYFANEFKHWNKDE